MSESLDASRRPATKENYIPCTTVIAFLYIKKKSLISWLVIVSVPAAGNFRACTRELAPRLGQSFSLPVNSIANLIQLLALVILRVELPLNSLNVGSFRRTEAQNKRTGIG